MKKIQKQQKNKTVIQDKNFTIYRRFLFSTSLLILLFSIQSANAQCTPDPAEPGDEVICTGVDDDGFRHRNGGVSVIIEDGALLTDTLDLRGEGNRLLNRGSIIDTRPVEIMETFNRDALLPPSFDAPAAYVNEGLIFAQSFGNALLLDDGAFLFENGADGAIVSENATAVILGFNYSGALINSGLIEGFNRSSSQDGYAINAAASEDLIDGVRRLGIINNQTGIIRSETDTAIFTSGNGAFDINNYGLIEGIRAILIDENSIVNNFSTGQITATNGSGIFIETAGNNFSVVNNEGVISAPVAAIAGFAFGVNNSGTLNGGVFSLDRNANDPGRNNSRAEITNTGEINGDIILASGNDTVENLTGFIGGDIDLAAGDDIFRTTHSAVNAGAIDGGEGSDTISILSANGEISFDNISNFERLEISSQSQSTLQDTEQFGDTLQEIAILEGRVNLNTNARTQFSVSDGAILGGDGTIDGDLLVNGAILLSEEVGALTISGDVVLDDASSLIVEISSQSPNSIDLLNIESDLIAENGFSIEVTSIDSATLSEGAEFAIASIAGQALVDLSLITISTVGFNEMVDFSLALLDGFLTLRASEITPSEVPLPSALIFLVTGLAAAGAGMRRRQCFQT